MISTRLFLRASGVALTLALAAAATPALSRPTQPEAQSTAPANDGLPESAPPRVRMSQEEMQERIEELQRQLDFMKQVAAEQTSGVASVQARPAVTLPNGKPTFATADGNFSATINAVLQFDAGNYYQDNNLPTAITGPARDLNGGTNARRSRFGVGGKVFGDFDYNILYEFGSGSGSEDAGHIQEFWIQYTGFLKPFHARVGYFEPLVGMEANTSTNQIALLERASGSEIGRNVAAGDSRAAFQIFGNDDFKNVTFANGAGKVHWMAAGSITGNTVSTVNATGGFATQPFDEQLGVIGRVAVAPYKGSDYTLHLGANFSHVFNVNDNTGRGSAIAGRYTVQLRDRPELRLDTTRLVDTGALNADNVTTYGGEVGFQWKSFWGQAEYFRYEVNGNKATPATFDHTFYGWYVEGSYIFTGENRVYNAGNGAFGAPVVAHPFNWKDKTWGALELAGRYSTVNLNSAPGVAGAATPFGGVRGGEQKVYSVSLDWYLNPVIRFVLQGQHVDIDRLNAAGLPIGQGYNTVAIRSQLAF